MKDKIWLFQIPVILAFTFAYYVLSEGEKGNLSNQFLRTEAFPLARNIQAAFTDLKFHVRGPTKPKNKIVIVAVDSYSIETFGRWPWHRDIIAYVIKRTFDAGAKVVGTDIVFSEPDKRVPEALVVALNENKLGYLAEQAETDPVLAQEISNHKDRLVLGWTTESGCQPGYEAPENCPVAHPDAIATHPPFQQKFAYSHFQPPKHFDPQKTPVMSAVDFISNIALFSSQAAHSGYFNAFPDSDGYIRRTSLVTLANGTPYPSLPLEMARVGLGEELSLKMNDELKVDEIKFANSGRKILVSPLGTMAINFRGPSYTFPYVSVMDVVGENSNISTGMNREIATTKENLLQDAYVLIGVSALGVHDMRAFPFDSNTPGVEGHATILDNILSNDYLVPGSAGAGSLFIFFLMLFGALAFAYFTGKLDAVPALLLFIGVIFGFGGIDQKLLFENQINWNTSFLYIELFVIFVLTLAAKYILEEKDKRFLKSAFSKYVAPAVVDSIVEDPKSLSLGGKKTELTILFSDIRSFTTMSEKMDAKVLASFLNDYLGDMTGLVFANRGTLDKYIGDAVMAFWGAPIEDKDHARNACIASVQMQKKLRELQPMFLEKYGIEVNVGVGLNSGLVSVGNMGSDDNFNYTVLGDHVNLASRVEGLTKYYGVTILTTRFTVDSIERAGSEMPAHRTLDFVKVKGKEKAVELLQVIDTDLPQEGLKKFEEARQFYSQQKWDEAIEAFETANQMLRPGPETHDGPTKMYIRRCNDFKKNSPGPDWDGSWQMTTK